MERIIKLFKQHKPFPNGDEQIEIYDFEYTANRMGGSPVIKARTKYKDCLDDMWSGVYTMFNGEKYYINNTPSSSKNNSDTRYEYELELLSERSILGNIYFIDKVTNTKDTRISNSPKVQFFGNIDEFARRLEACIKDYGYTVIVDKNLTDGNGDKVNMNIEKLVSFENKFILEALQEAFSIFEIPYYFKGKEIHFGYTTNVIITPAEYGFDKALLAISKNNSNYKIVNRSTGVGSNENIPYYYPNITERGDFNLILRQSRTGQPVKETTIDKDNLDKKKYVAKTPTASSFVYHKDEARLDINQILNPQKEWEYDVDGQRTVNFVEGSQDITFHFRNKVKPSVGEYFKLPNDTLTYFEVEPSVIATQTTGVDMIHSGASRFGYTDSYIQVEYVDGKTQKYYPTWIGEGNKINIMSFKNIKIPSGSIAYLYINFTEGWSGVDVNSIQYKVKTPSYNSWFLGDKQVMLSDYGISLPKEILIAGFQSGDTISQNFVGVVIPYSDKLMPPKYKETNGNERFYNALNNTYKRADGSYYEFKNLYTETNPREDFKEYDIKPSIVGMTNKSNQRIDMFSAIAFDEDDNNEIDPETNKFYHPYFFAKLRKFDGDFGFNLFDYANEKEPMSISMTSGDCGACKFNIAVGEKTKKNIVQVDSKGNLIYQGEKGKGRVVLREGQGQPQQNDTQNNEVWIALKKDTNTYPTTSPDYIRGIKVKAGDTFVILGCSLPTAYVDRAEKQLKDAIIEDMFNNNLEKFSFPIQYSRIFFAENPDILANLNENSRIKVVYNKKEIPLYIDEFTYKMEHSSPLPEIGVNLVETLEPTSNSLQTTLDAAKQDILSSVNRYDALALGLKYFLRKDVSDSAYSLLKFLAGSEFGAYERGIQGASIEPNGNAEFNEVNTRGEIKTNKISSKGLSTGALGSGFLIREDEQGKSYMEVDQLYVRMKAMFTELQINSLSYTGGNLVCSPASMVCEKVEEDSLSYICYFKKKEYEVSIKNEFRDGDLVFFEEFNIDKGTSQNVGNRRYWRRCIQANPNDNFIVLSKTDCEKGSDAPQAGDRIVVLGHIQNQTESAEESKQRQNAIVISSYGEGSPAIIQYMGINNYSLKDKERTRISPNGNKFIGEFYIKAGVPFSVGTRNYLLKSNVKMNSNQYLLGHYDFIKEGLEVGETYTLTIKYKTDAKQGSFLQVFQDDGHTPIGRLEYNPKESITYFRFEYKQSDRKSGLYIFQFPKSAQGFGGLVRWATLTKGNAPSTSWFESTDGISAELKVTNENITSQVERIDGILGNHTSSIKQNADNIALQVKATEGLETKYSEIEQTTNNISLKVGSIEKDILGFAVGGINLLEESFDAYYPVTDKSYPIKVQQGFIPQLQNKDCVFSALFIGENIVADDLGIECEVIYKDSSVKTEYLSAFTKARGDFGDIFIFRTFKIKDSPVKEITVFPIFRNSLRASGTLRMSKPMFEIGTKPTSWKPPMKNESNPNLLLGTSSTPIEFTSKSEYKTVNNDSLLKKGTWLCASAYLELQNVIANQVGIELEVDYKDGTRKWFNSIDSFESRTSELLYKSLPFRLEKDVEKIYSYALFRNLRYEQGQPVYSEGEGIVKISQQKLELGSYPTKYVDDNSKRLLDTGIDIENKKITLTSDTTVIRSNEGRELLLVTADGKLRAETIDTDNLVAKQVSTANNGKRVVISDNTLQMFDNENNLRLKVTGDELGSLDTSSSTSYKIEGGVATQQGEGIQHETQEVSAIVCDSINITNSSSVLNLPEIDVEVHVELPSGGEANSDTFFRFEKIEGGRVTKTYSSYHKTDTFRKETTYITYTYGKESFHVGKGTYRLALVNRTRVTNPDAFLKFKTPSQGDIKYVVVSSSPEMVEIAKNGFRSVSKSGTDGETNFLEQTSKGTTIRYGLYMLMVSKDGIRKSRDGGNTWTNI